MSKPKPGLGKGIVRTLQAHPNGSTSSLVTSKAVSQHVAAYSTTSRPWESGSKSREGYGTSRREASFTNLGVPSTFQSNSASTSTATSWPSSSSGANPWDNEVVLPFRPTQALSRGKSRGSRSYHSSASSSLSFSGLDRLIPIDIASLGKLVSSYLPGKSFDPSSFNYKQTFFNSFNTGDTSTPLSPLETSLVSGGAPGPRAPRPNELHSALSPTTSNNLASNSDPSFFPVFTTLGIPHQAAYDPYISEPSTSEGATLNTYSSSLIFHLGATGSAKERPVFSRDPARTTSPPPPPRSRSFPIPQISPPSSSEIRSTSIGEDAYFTRMDGMCIADGVGGWARSGRSEADAGRWSRLLTHFCEVEVGNWWAGKEDYLVASSSSSADSEAEASLKAEALNADADEDSRSKNWAKRAWKAKKASASQEARRRPLDPVEIMQRGYEKCLSCFLTEGIHGSSTCLLALLHQSTLLVANLGDCCLMVIRAGRIIFRTDEMQHAFNFPLQVGTHSRDEPMKDAKRFDVNVGRGDVVVVGSDGLMDNLFESDILDTLTQFAPPKSLNPFPTPPSSRPSSPGGLPPFSPQKVSEALCQRARAVSEETSATTPFMMKAIEEGIDFVGGKKDDISVLVGVIGDRSEPGQNGDGLALHTQ